MMKLVIAAAVALADAKWCCGTDGGFKPDDSCTDLGCTDGPSCKIAKNFVANKGKNVKLYCADPQHVSRGANLCQNNHPSGEGGQGSRNANAAAAFAKSKCGKEAAKVLKEVTGGLGAGLGNLLKGITGRSLRAAKKDKKLCVCTDGGCEGKHDWSKCDEYGCTDKAGCAIALRHFKKARNSNKNLKLHCTDPKHISFGQNDCEGNRGNSQGERDANTAAAFAKSDCGKKTGEAIKKVTGSLGNLLSGLTGR